MRSLIQIHRWLGIPLCLLFAMWFATGIVMHFVPFPALTEAERFAGLAPLRLDQVRHAPADAVARSGLREVARVRLIGRADGAVYLVQGAGGLAALRASDLSPAPVTSDDQALQIARAHAQQRGLDSGHARVVERAMHDQWSVPNGLDAHRPLYRIALDNANHAGSDDNAGTELYVSSVTGEVVRDTTAHERRWNTAGSVLHWIYPTLLRRDWKMWDATVWWLSLAAMVGAATGAALGLLRLRWRALWTMRPPRQLRQLRQPGHRASPYQGWQQWHHWLGLVCMAFVLTWIFSGWLSMDHGRLFSDGRTAPADAARITGTADWPRTLNAGAMQRELREVEWFVFNSGLWQRERTALDAQHLANGTAATRWLPRAAVDAALRQLRSDCAPATTVAANDDYPLASSLPGAPVYRSVCGDTWLHVDGADGRLLEQLDPSRRAYRWAYQALHTLDFPALAARPALRTALVVLLCCAGFGFSLTGVVIAWRRLRQQF